jgi:hypothetical protein
MHFAPGRSDIGVKFAPGRSVDQSRVVAQQPPSRPRMIRGGDSRECIVIW